MSTAMKQIRLSNVLTEIIDKTEEDGKYRVLTSSQNGIISQEDYFNKKVASRDTSGYKIIRKGQFTYRAMSDTGRFYINRLDDYDIGIVSPAYPVFEIKDDNEVSSDYLTAFFKSEKFQSDIAHMYTGSTRASLKFKNLRDVVINVPDKEEQKKRLTVLKIIDRELSIVGKIENKLDDAVKSRFIEMFENGKYSYVKASDVCEFITKGTTPPSGELIQDYEEGLIPYLKVYNLSFNGELLFDEEPQYISRDVHEGLLSRSKVYPNDVLMNIVGPPLGKFSLVNDEYDEWNINQAIAIFRAKDVITPRFLLHALMQPNVIKPFIDQAVGVRQLNISLEQCRNLEFPLPPLENQNEFVRFSEEIDKSKLVNNKAIKSLLNY